MKLKELKQINDIIHELWDFFTTNTDSDETGLVEDMEGKYVPVKKIIQDEFYKLHLRNELSKVRTSLKRKK